MIRPILDSRRRMDVEFRLSLKRLFELDETNLKVTLFTIIYKTWQDEFLKWDPKDFGDITETYVTSSDIWLPRMILATRFVMVATDMLSFGSWFLVFQSFCLKICRRQDCAQ